jgi:hypothetical protein
VVWNAVSSVLQAEPGDAGAQLDVLVGEPGDLRVAWVGAVSGGS